MGHFPKEWKRLVWQVYPYCAVCGKYISEDELLAPRLIQGHAIYRIHASPMHMALVHRECHYTTSTYGRSSPDDPLEYLFSQGEPPVGRLSDWFRE
jgi:hypothetical protein